VYGKSEKRIELVDGRACPGEALPTGSHRLPAAAQVSALPGYAEGNWWVPVSPGSTWPPGKPWSPLAFRTVNHSASRKSMGPEPIYASFASSQAAAGR
ncbi:hypothetical protein VB636_00190, partial [Paracoccus sp. APAP_BH8]|uniref:hypothetical protein n=1 Tax=Paracoccus sp. APAP_BH8 TaxID=3110237 RepID=UPI002FD860E5